MILDVTLNVINTQTKQNQKYDAYFDSEGNGEISLKDDKNHQKFNELIDTIESSSSNYSLEVIYGDKIANATYELEYNCIVISMDSKKRLLNSKKSNKKLK